MPSGSLFELDSIVDTHLWWSRGREQSWSAGVEWVRSNGCPHVRSWGISDLNCHTLEVTVGLLTARLVDISDQLALWWKAVVVGAHLSAFVESSLSIGAFTVKVAAILPSL